MSIILSSLYTGNQFVNEGFIIPKESSDQKYFTLKKTYFELRTSYIKCIYDICQL